MQAGVCDNTKGALTYNVNLTQASRGARLQVEGLYTLWREGTYINKYW